MVMREMLAVKCSHGGLRLGDRITKQPAILLLFVFDIMSYRINIVC